MAKQRLTDRDDISGVTLTDLLHFVVTGDTSQNPAGSSFKGNVEQLFDAFSSYTCTNPLIVETVNACSSGITINGNVTINGSATTINTEVIQSKDNNIILNYSGTHLTALNGGITVEDGQSNGVDSVLYIDSDGCWHADPGFCDLTVDGLPFTGQTPYLFVENGTVNSITTRYSGNTITTSDYSNIGGGQNNVIDDESSFSTIGGGLGNNLSTAVRSFVGGGYYNFIQLFSTNSSIVGGNGNNIEGSNNSTIVGGKWNIIETNSHYSMIGGGQENEITDDVGFSSIVGGKDNWIKTRTLYSSVVGGQNNRIQDVGTAHGFIGGGLWNSVDGGSKYSSIVGGSNNEMVGQSSFIGGGYYNKVEGALSGPSFSSVVGGKKNVINNSNFSVIGGGESNQINLVGGNHSFIGAGSGNTMSNSQYSVIGGGYNNRMNDSSWSSIVGGYNNYLKYSNFSEIVGGFYNNILDNGWISTIVGGYNNVVSGESWSVIVHGVNNIIGDAAPYSSIVGGENNHIHGSGSRATFIGGGDANTVNNSLKSSIVGGSDNVIGGGSGSNINSFIGGGSGNNITGNTAYSVIGGGLNNVITDSTFGFPFGKSFIGAGTNNIIGDTVIGNSNSSIVGGENNHIHGTSGRAVFIGGGDGNSIIGTLIDGTNSNSIVGGTDNTIDTTNSGALDGARNFIGGGFGNTNSSRFAGVIGGGHANKLSGATSTILGGATNIIYKDTMYSHILGGKSNSIYNNLSTALQPSQLEPRFPKHQIIGGGYGNYIGGYTGFFQNQDKRAHYSIIGGGKNQSSYASQYSVIAGGYSNSHYFNEYGFIGAGSNNETVFSKSSNIVGGRNNYVRSSYYSSIVGGINNDIDSDGFLSLYQFIGGGKDNKLFGNTSDGLSNSSSIVGGEGNIISATTHSLIGGGQGNNINSIDDGGTSDARHQFIGGGKDNKLFNITTTGGAKLSNYSSVIGGEKNVISASTYSLIGGGYGGQVINSNNSSIVGGYRNQVIGSDYSSIVGGKSNIVNHSNTHIIGSNITSVSANTTHVERFNIGTIDSGSASTDILVREVNGMISTVPASAITTNDTYVTGGTYNNNSGVATFANNSGITFNISGFTSEVNLGDVLYVSEYGDDSTAVKGNPHKPWADIHTAKSASTSGDTIYVHPQTITFDNTNSAGNPYNGQVDTLVNLWKDGVTYYFSPNTKIILTNETVTGESMYLFSPVATTGETCTVLGHLEYEQFSTGADSSNGANYFYHNNNSGEMGSTFYAEVKKFSSYHCEIIKVIKYNTTPTNVTLISQEEYWDYLGGQTSTGGFYSINASAGAINFKAYCKSRVYTSGIGYGFYFRNDCSNSTIDVFGDKVESTSQIILLRDVIGGTVNIVIGDIHYQNAYTPFGYIGAVLSTTAGTGGCTINLTANLHDLEPTTSTQGVFYLRNTNNTLNFKGSINTKTSGGVGRFISSSTVAGNVININGDITHLGTGTTTEIFFQSAGSGSVTNYTGKISGNFASGIARPTSGGVININNSYIDSIVDGGTSSVFQNSTTAIGTGRLNNSYVRLTNNTNGVVDGEDNNIFINNSTVINLGTGSTVAYNTTNNGDLQVVNSTLISSYSGSTSIEYTGSTTVISSNTTVNTNYNITDLKGNITTLTELIY